MYKIRNDEPDYAFVPVADGPIKNRYGEYINLAEENAELTGKSLNINGDKKVSENPNRYKQHGFYFNADNCISCHACESACSEKNNLPPYLAYRAVGYVEGGSYPSYTRLNISMACNHCDNPVCLKGCPTRAYTKYAEYGAVLQDPDICFGCGYCTWVCPYNAPQLDTEKGHVHKCNMCVDRLEVGLKPACATACLAGALDFGVVETLPDNRHQLKAQIPGFPTPDITHPNVRFQQTKSLPDEMKRTDSIALKYRRDVDKDEYITEIDKNKIVDKTFWNLKKLLTSHENAHIIFTICTQSVIGAFMIMMFGRFFDNVGLTSGSVMSWPLLITMFLLMGFGMAKLNLHLGRPQRFYRGFYNWRLSPVSREIAGVSLFFIGFTGYVFLSLFDHHVAHWLAEAASILAVLGGVIGMYYMIKLYLIPARPFWNHWQTASSFIGTSLALGASMILLVTSLSGDGAIIQPKSLLIIALSGLMLEAMGLLFHARHLRRRGGEGALAYFEQISRYGKTYWLRNILLTINIISMLVFTFVGIQGVFGAAMGIILLISMLVSSVLGRALFYVLVIPTTMPGAFFWRNRGFQEHARESGLANMAQTGVLP